MRCILVCQRAFAFVKGEYIMKKLILVTSPPASGKTYVSKKLSQRLRHVVYLDKDTLAPLSKKVFDVVGEAYNRSSDFFYKYVRDAEYEAIISLALEALEYDDIVLINAPFTKEIRDAEYMNNLRESLKEHKARLIIIWVQTDVEVCRKRMIERASPRDKWKLENWDEYIMTQDFSIPEAIDDPSVADDLLIFHNSNDEQFEKSMREISSVLEELPMRDAY